MWWTPRIIFKHCVFSWWRGNFSRGYHRVSFEVTSIENLLPVSDDIFSGSSGACLRVDKNFPQGGAPVRELCWFISTISLGLIRGLYRTSYWDYKPRFTSLGGHHLAWPHEPTSKNDLTGMMPPWKNQVPMAIFQCVVMWPKNSIWRFP